MIRKFFFTIFLNVCYSFLMHGQTDFYLKKHSYLLNDSLRNSNLFTYNFYFFGETHDSYNLSKQQIVLLNQFKNIGLTQLFFEFPINYSSPINDLLFSNKKDTIYYRFDYFSDNIEFKNLLRYVYKYNKSAGLDDKFRVVLIDNIRINEISPRNILGYYEKKTKNPIIKNDLNKIIAIKKHRKFSQEVKFSLYMDFYQLLLNHKKEHTESIGVENYIKISKYLKALSINEASIKSDTNYFQSPLREDFMFQNICDEIKQNDSLKFISFNGHFHIPLSVQKEWVGAKNWESLAYKVKTAYPQKRICSVYFMNRQDDQLSDQYFPSEKKLILDNTKPGEPYLIRLDGENTPFKELSQKFQYIVVW